VSGHRKGEKGEERGGREKGIGRRKTEDERKEEEKGPITLPSL